MNQYHKTKGEGSFDDLEDEVMDKIDLTDSKSLTALSLREKGQEIKEDLTLSELNGVQQLTDVFCEYYDYSFNECMEVKRGIISQNQANVCIDSCESMLLKNYPTMMPEFEDMAPSKQKFEKCLDDFKGPHEFFDYQNKTSINVKDMLSILRKNGFVVIKNFFPSELMSEVHYVMNNWDESGEWNNLTYSDFYSSNKDQLNEYENRLEIVLPFVDPFETVLATIHGSILMECK